MRNRRPITLYYQTTDGECHVLESEFRSVEQAGRIGDKLIVQRPEIERIEARRGDSIVWGTDRAQWEGWL